MSTLDLGEILYLQLKLLGFDGFLKEEGRKKKYSCLRSVVFDPSMFLTVNKLAFQAVYFFCLKKLGVKKYLIKGKDISSFDKDVQALFPCEDKSQEKDFRTLVTQFLECISQDPDFTSREGVSLRNMVLNPGGSTFMNLTLRVLSYIMFKSLTAESRQLVRNTPTGSETDIKTREIWKSRAIETNSSTTFVSKTLNLTKEIIDSVVDSLKEKKELQEALVHQQEKFKELMENPNSCYYNSKDFLDEIKKLQIETSTRGSTNDVVVRVINASTEPVACDISEFFRTILRGHRILVTSKSNWISNLCGATASNVVLLLELKNLFESIPNQIQNSLSISIEKTSKVKQELENYPKFKAEIDKVEARIGITRQLPIVSFKPMKPLTEEHGKRWRAIGIRKLAQKEHPKERPRVTFECPSVETSSSSQMEVLSPGNEGGPSFDLSFNASYMNLTTNSILDSPPVFGRSSLGLLRCGDITEESFDEK